MQTMALGATSTPPQKQNCGRRLGNSALALQYKQAVVWKSPSYASAAAGAASATITLQDVPPGGLTLKPSANTGTLDCTKNANVCAWAALPLASARPQPAPK